MDEDDDVNEDERNPDDRRAGSSRPLESFWQANNSQ